MCPEPLKPIVVTPQQPRNEPQPSRAAPTLDPPSDTTDPPAANVPPDCPDVLMWHTPGALRKGVSRINPELIGADRAFTQWCWLVVTSALLALATYDLPYPW